MQQGKPLTILNLRVAIPMQRKTPIKSKPPKERGCNLDGCEVRFTPHPSRPIQAYCCPAHERQAKQKRDQAKGKKPKAIKAVSDKRAARLAEYYPKREAYLALPENRLCACGCGKVADTVEHTRGRQHDVFWDDEARATDTPLLTDVRWWKPFNAICNQRLERDSDFSHQHQLSRIHNGKKGDNKG